MKTGFDQDTILYRLLMESPLKTAISGQIYKWVRPDDSRLEDVVINHVVTESEQVQRGISNVNIYVPALLVRPETKTGRAIPDLSRMAELTALVVDLLAGVYEDTYQVWVGDQKTIEEAGAWYVNLRIDFQFLPSF